MRVHRSNGFTIVELLVVIVILAILATITVTSINGIQDRSRDSAASTAAAQAYKKVTAWQVDNPSTSPDCSQFYVILSNNSNTGECTFELSGSSYQYTPSTAGAYCITVTNGNKSQKVTNTGLVGTGGCPGHGQSGAIAITNLVTNPSGATTLNYGTQGSAGGAISTRSDGTAFAGNTYLRRTVTTESNAGIITSQTNRYTVAGAKSYTFSCYFRGTSTVTFGPRIIYYDGAGASIGTVIGQAYTMSGSWQRMTMTALAPANAVTARVYFSSVSSNVPAGSTVDGDAFMLTEGASTYTYADGDSSNWVWNGSANDATSTGPQL